MLIKNGTIFSPGTETSFAGDLKTEGERIVSIGAPGTLKADPGETCIDASNCVVAPGLVDVHVHLRDPGFTHKEDLHTGARSAAAGGFTTICCMANTNPVIDNPKTLKELLSRAKEESIRIHFHAAVTEELYGSQLTDFETLASSGACGFSDDGIPLNDEKVADAAMQRVKGLDLPIAFHEEDPAYVEKPGSNRTAPAIAEDLMVARDCVIDRYAGATILIQHVSSAVSVDLIRAAKALGIPVFAEATPHHFSLTEDAVKEYGSFAKVSPPLRTEADRQAIIKGLKDGTIDLISTDHAPHTTKEKRQKDFFSAPCGIIGLETSLALGITNLVRPGYLTLMELLKKMTTGPARLYRIDAGAQPSSRGLKTTDPVSDAHYGSIREGSIADLVIFNPEESFRAGPYQSKSENTPFTGQKLYGKIHATICGGRVVWENA